MRKPRETSDIYGFPTVPTITGDLHHDHGRFPRWGVIDVLIDERVSVSVPALT